MAGYKSLQVADALQRVSASLAPKVTTTSIDNTNYANNYTALDPTLQAQQIINTPLPQTTNRNFGEYAQDAALSLGKGIVAVPQALAGLVDLADVGLQKGQQLSQSALAAVGLEPEVNWEVQGGRFTKALEDLGINFKETQQIATEHMSDPGLRQLQELAALPGMSTQKSVGENLSSLGQTAQYALENPSLIANTIIESAPSIVAGGAIGRGASLLGSRAAGAAGAIGEGTIMAGAAQANMDRNAEGYTTGQQALGALGIGILGGLVGQAGQRIAGHAGAADINSLAAGQAARGANQGFKSLAAGTATEAAEEAAQSALENVISNVTSNKDALDGLNTDLVLGTFAGAGMGAAANTRSSVASAALNALQGAAEKNIAKMREKIEREAPEQTETPTEEFTNPSSSSYNPAAAITREAKKINEAKTPEEELAVKTSVDKVLQDAENHLGGLVQAQEALAKLEVTRTNIVNATNFVEQIQDTQPEKAEQIKSLISSMQAQVEVAEKYEGKEAELADYIKQTEQHVQAAREMHSKYDGLLNRVVNGTGTIEIDKQIFGAPTTYTPEQITKAIEDPTVPENSKVALRALNEAVIAQNAVKDIDTVNQQIVGKKFDPDYRSTPQYLEQFSKALNTGSTIAANNLMREITNFEQSHVQKAELVAQGLEYSKQGIPVQIIRTAEGTWQFNQDTFLKGDEAKKNGALTMHATPRGIAASERTNEYMQVEAKAITATKAAMEAMSNTYAPKPNNTIASMQRDLDAAINTTTPDATVTETSNVSTPDYSQSQEVPTQQAATSSDDFQSALDDLNLEQRGNYDWQANSRVDDPRTMQPSNSIDGVGQTEAGVLEGTQPTTGTESDTATTETLTQPELLQPEVAQAERVASRSDSEDVATEVQASTQEANQATQQESLENVVTAEVKPEPQPQDIHTSESPDELTKVMRKQERAKAPNKRNLVWDGFNRKPTVLNTNENFITNFSDTGALKDTVEQTVGSKLTPKQEQSVNDFVKMTKYMSPKLDGLIEERKGKTAKGNDYADFKYQDFNQFLLEDGKLPENVKTAVTAGAYTWLAENGSKTINTEKDVANLLLLNDVEVLPSHVYSQLSRLGDHQSVVAASLGQKALQALGLKVVDDVDPARRAKLEMALGTMAVVSLVQDGFLTRTTMPRSQFDKLRADAQQLNEDATDGNMTIADASTMAFIAPATDANGKPVAKVDRVIKSAAKSGSVISKMFDVASDIQLPSTEPVKDTPRTFNRMGSEIPDFAKDVYTKSQQNSYSMSKTAMQFMDNVDRADLLDLFGYVQPNADGSFDNMHKKFWEGTHAANQALERSLSIIDAQRENLGSDDKPFYFAHTIWTNQRSGYDSAFNLQANKVHRAVAGMTDHIVEIGLEPTHRNGETTKFGEFLMAVAMSAEGVSDILEIPTVDKMSSESFLPKFQEYLARDYVQEGMESMASVLEGDKPTKAELASIKRVVTEFGMGPMSVRALQALAQMYIAQRDGARTFTTDIAFESDGVTNGPVITNVALNTADNAMLEAGGVFTDKTKTNVPTNKEQGSEDIYEQLGGVMQQEWTTLKAGIKFPLEQNAAKALDKLYPAFGKRKGAKPITTTSNYGAGNASIKRANGREVLSAFYKSLEKAGIKGNVQEAQELIDAVNSTIAYVNQRTKTSTPLAKAQGNILEFMLTQEQETALLQSAEFLHGKAIENTLKTAMGDFQAVRDSLTQQAVTGFKVYDIVRKAALDEALKDTTDVITDSKGTRQEGLTSKQQQKALKQIAKYTPSVVSGMGNNSANAKQSSIPLMKQDTVWDGSAMSEQQFKFLGSWNSKQGKGFSVRASIKRDAVSDPGVSGLALIIQSLDAFIAHSTLAAMPVQNYHDANASAVGQGKEMAKVQNEAFVDGLMTTHVNREFVRALLKPLQAMKDNKALYDANKAAVDAIVSEMDVSLADQVKAAYARDMAKLDGMKQWENVNQYGTQGGHFVMTAAKRKEIVDAVDKLKADMKKDLAQAETLDQLFNAKAPEAKTVQTMLNEGTVAAADLIPVLQAEIKQFQNKSGDTGKFSQFYDSMLDLITARLPASLEINYFERGAEPANVAGIEEATTHNNPAWFTTGKNGNPQINIIKSNSPVKAQLLVHELVHAITVDSIAQVRKEPTAHAKAAESLSKLDALYEDIKAKVKADPNATELMKYATQNVEEFIATGFSYPEFVNYLDTQLAPKAVRGKNRIITALRAFVDNILGILESFTGRKYSAKDATALEALIIDSAEFLGRTVPQTTGTQSNIFGAPQQARDKVSGFTAKQVFSVLGSHADPEFQKHLDTMMTQVADSLFSGLDSKFIDNDNGSWSETQAWQEYITSGQAETTETATTAGFTLSQQEQFAVEAVYTAMVHGLKDKSMTQVYSEMQKSYQAAKAKLKPQDFFDGDWSTASKQDKADAQGMYDYFFKLGANNKEYLARFVSMALGSQQFNEMLGFHVRDTAQAPTTTFEKMVEGLNRVLDFLGGLLTNSSSNQNINKRITLLSKELARIDAKNRDSAVGKVESQLEKLQDYTNDISDKLRDQVVKIADNKKLAESRNTYVRLASHTTRLAAKGDLWTTLDTLKDMRNIDKPNTTLGLMGEIINEAANNDSTKNGVEKMMRLTKLNNQMKENIRETTTNNIMSTFEENGKYLTKDDRKAISNMLRADVQVLTSTYSTAEIARMYSNHNYLSTERGKLEQQLRALDHQPQLMINQAKQLAKYMITGKSSESLAPNAQLIVSGFNSGEVVELSDPRVDLVDKIATMYAIEYTPAKEKAKLNAVMKRELKNKTNGIDTSIKFHKELANEARETLFVDNATSVIKGYLPEITNPNREVRVANNEQEANLLRQQYYKEVKSLYKDAKDPTATQPRLFMTEEANIQRLVSGAVEVVSTNRKGTQVNMDAKQFANTLNKIKVPSSPTYNPMNDPNVYMRPNFNTDGQVIGFSYEMSASNRDSLLERNNDFSELLGAYAATNFNKVTVPDQNNKVVDAAYQDYKANFANNPRAYVTVGPNSNDVGLREIWAMLPEATRQHIIKTWGKDGMQVRNDVLLTMFGYRKYSINQAFDKMPEAQTMFESMYTELMTTFFGSLAKQRGVQIERVWQEAVRLMKDIVVIRNVKTMVANTMSNAMLLSAHGVKPTDIVKDSMLAVRAGMQYRKDMALLMAARQKQRAGVGDFDKLEQEALKYEDSLNRNPLKDFIEEGMMPTIVEDVDPSNDHYSYKSKMQQRVDDLTSGVPESVKTAAKWAMVSPDTPLYQFLNNATQMADFSSKYVMYKYYTQNAKEKMSHDEAIQTASDNFINYDVPTARGLQYLNDMGIVMFTKYNIRIQKALFQLLKKRPAGAMAQALFIHSFTNLEAGIDPIIWGNIGVPLRSGALGLPSALDEPLPIKMMTGGF